MNVDLHLHPSKFLRPNYPETTKEYERIVGITLGNTSIWATNNMPQENKYDRLDATTMSTRTTRRLGEQIVRYFGRYLSEPVYRGPSLGSVWLSYASNPQDDYNCLHFLSTIAREQMPYLRNIFELSPSENPKRIRGEQAAIGKAVLMCLDEREVNGPTPDPMHGAYGIGNGKYLGITGLGGNLTIMDHGEMMALFNFDAENADVGPVGWYEAASFR